MDLDIDRLCAALRRLRIGYVTCRRQFLDSPQGSQLPAADPVGMEAMVPAWLIGSLVQGVWQPQAKLSIFSTFQEDELWAVISMQRGSSAQLRLVLPLDDAGAQQLLRQGLSGGPLLLTLDADDAELSATVDLNLPLADPGTLELLLRRARCLPGSLTRLALFVEANSSGTLMSGARADTVDGTEVVVLVSNRAHDLVGTHGHGSRGFDLS